MSRTFPIIQSWLKSSGDKRLVLDIARRSIEASKSPGRGREQVRDEALAIICGVSWVYQRTGRLLEARTEAERSLALGQDINWDRNTAFCNKCLGRLNRMEAETVSDVQQRINEPRTWVDRETELLLTREPVGVRVRVARIVKNETAARPVGRSHREKLSQNYLRGLISRAKREYAVERPAW